MNSLPIWARPRPKNLGKSIPLTAAQKRKAKSLAAAAGRKYPNLVDNIAVSRNPTMKKPSPAQIAARKKFAEMARSGALNRKRQIASKANPMQKFTVFHRGTRNVAGEVIASGEKAARQKVAEKLGIPTLIYLVARKTNPAKKTVSQKISQLVHEGYPQKQSIAIALSEQRKGKVKANPNSSIFKVGQYYETRMIGDYNQKIGAEIVSRTDKSVTVIGTDNMMKTSYRLTKDQDGNEIFYPYGRYSMAPIIKSDKAKQKTNPASGRKGSQTLLNPMAAAVKSKSHSNFKYCVEAKRSLGSAGSVFETVAMFATKAQAQDYAKAILKSHPSVTLRIKTYK
jgi:hypothetical protein